MQDRNRILKILEILKETYPDAKTALEYKNPFELLIATMLSAQSTDKQVNKITKDLFKIFKGPEDFAALTPEELEKHIKSCGLYKTKSRNIIAACRALVEKHGGRVPDNFESLTSLPGVGRKTANVVLSNAFGQDAIAVDTHVFRVARRLKMSDKTTPAGVEKDLQNAIPKNLWSKTHHWLIFHGRAVCTARSPKCGRCQLREWCISSADK